MPLSLDHAILKYLAVMQFAIALTLRICSLHSCEALLGDTGAMKRAQPQSLAPFAWVAGIAFLLGRCSVDGPPPSVSAQQSVVGTVPAASEALETQATGPEEAQGAAQAEPAAAAQPEIPLPRASRRSSFVGETYFPNCSAARAAGAAPIHDGEPGYAPHLDRDSDGVACER